MFLFYIILFIFIFEIIIFLLVEKFKKKFQWLLTNQDEFPNFNKEKFNNFKKNSLDEKLGWKQKLDSAGLEQNKKKYAKNSFLNHRNLSNKKKTKLISSFGDSYVYCNFSKDQFTWQEQISNKNNFNILNYGVANYGFDQALLKYQNTKTHKKTKIIIIGFVPETIVRIQTRWKHYVEFGNINGFKPCFYLKNNKLILKKNPISRRTNIKNLRSIIKKLRSNEIFYKKKFQKYKFSFPYSFSYVKNFIENSLIFYYLIQKQLFISSNKKKISNINNKLFNIILKRNIKESHKLYKDFYSTELLKKLILKFKQIANKRNHKPIIIIFPQPLDLRLKSFKNVKSFIEILKKKIDLIDLSNYINKTNLSRYYMQDKYGGHFSKFGNKKISQIINKNIKKFKNNYTG